MEQPELSHTAVENWNSTMALETIWQFVWKLNIHLLYDSAISLLGIYPRGKEACNLLKPSAGIFTVALSVVAPNWQQLTFPSADEWLNKVWYILQWNLSSNKEQTIKVHYNIDCILK